MVSLVKNENMKQREVQVEHLLTEEETIMQTAVQAKTAEPIVVVQQSTTPPAIAKNIEAQLAAAKQGFEQAFSAFTWAVFVIFALLFVFNWVLSALMTPDNPSLELPFTVGALVTGSLMLGALIANICNKLNIHL